MTTVIAVLASLLSFATAAPAKSREFDAAKVFQAKCSACHGKEGKGNPKMAKMFKTDPELMNLTGHQTTEKSDADLEKLIHDGKNKMPSFKGKLKDDEIKTMVAYVRGLGGKGEAHEKREKAEKRGEKE